MTKEVSPLDQVLIDTIQKVTNVSGEVYDGAKAVTEKSIDFAMQQAPEVVHQLLLYKLVESLAFFILGILLIVASGIFLVYGLRKYASSEWNDVHSPALMFLVLPTGAGFMTAATNIDWLKIWLAPKVYLIEYAANLLR